MSVSRAFTFYPCECTAFNKIKKAYFRRELFLFLEPIEKQFVDNVGVAKRIKMLSGHERDEEEKLDFFFFLDRNS